MSHGKDRYVGEAFTSLWAKEQMKTELQGWEINGEKWKKDRLDCTETPALQVSGE